MKERDKELEQLKEKLEQLTRSYEEETKRCGELTQALSKAKEANHSKNDFLMRMSREIRTPMNSIIGLVYLTRENAQNSRQVLENLDKIDMSAHFMLSFVDDILNLSQMESGNVALNQKNTDFMQFLEKLNKDAAAAVEGKGVSFSLKTRGKFAPEYCFDAEKLEKALRNLILRAIRDTPAGGCVKFAAELLHTDEKRAFFRFEIHDMGPGMDEEGKEHIFEPFEPENNRNTTLSGGTGLGMSVSKNMIDFMNGKIDVYSEKGEGTLYVVTLALDCVQDGGKERERRKSRGLDYDFSGKRALLVEDNEINIEITGNVLRHKHFDVDVAVNGAEAVELFQTHGKGYYDVILMDIRMPVMDGLTAAAKIRETEGDGSPAVPIVAMTANVFEEDVRKSFEAGMNAHLNKPVDVKQMYALLDKLLFG